MNDEISKICHGVEAGEFKSLAQLLTFVERVGPRSLAYKKLLNPPHKSFRLGITGPPGSGKSTLVAQLISYFRKKNLSVGVIAVDPSSSFTQGAILGDRIRYKDHFNDDQVFIRSLGTRGSLGGLSGSAYLMLRAFDLFNFDIVLVETVGVGQTELDILHVADLLTVVLTPESGDSIQAMKAGLIDVADTYVINKSDRPGAESLIREIEAITQMSLEVDSLEGKRFDRKIFSTVATEGDGITSWAQFIESKMNKPDWIKARDQIQRLQHEAKALLKERFGKDLELKALQVKDLESFQKLFFDSFNSSH